MLLPLLLAAAAPSAQAPEDIVRQFVAAYNERRYKAFETALAPDAKWYSVDGSRISVEGDGAAAIGRWVRNYLEKTCRTCRSELLSVSASGRFVATVERASWTGRDGACVAQSSTAVYEVADARIRAVWYFPASAKGPCK
jgi:hypothetical protein